ncbi:MAG: hypothetical protein LUF28_03330, partial [Clostridiales bacterium]|nr:hypothetical protein [Clostridiales bacterium]
YSAKKSSKRRRLREELRGSSVIRNFKVLPIFLSGFASKLAQDFAKNMPPAYFLRKIRLRTPLL